MRFSLSFVFCLVVFFLTLFSLNFPSLAAAGDLDLSFDGDGIVTREFPPSFNLTPLSANAVQSDGKIIFASTGMGAGTDSYTILRYNPNGSLDTTFGTGGVVNTSVGNFEGLVSVLLQPDGKIILSGERYSGTNLTDFVLVRYNQNGILDNSFDGNGIAVATIATFSEERGGAAALQSDGKIVVTGHTDNQTNNASFDWAIVRFNADGSLDNTFDIDGKVVLALGGDFELARSVAIQADGKIVVSGVADNGTNNDFTTIRLNTDGTLDSSFGIGGIVRTQFGNFNDFANSVKIQTDNKIIVAGGAGNGSNNDIALARYNADGTLDSGFGINGLVTATFSGTTNETAYSLSLQQDQKIIVSSKFGNNAAVLRFNSNGTPDNTFGSAGRVFNQILNFTEAYAFATAIQNDGKIVVSGIATWLASQGPNYYFTARYIAHSPNKTLFDYDGDGKADVSVFRPSNGVWYLNNSTNGFSAVSFGISTDKLVPADFDGDGKTDVSVFRDGNWYRLNSSNNAFTAVAFGLAGDTPMPADYDGDSKADQAVFRNGVWYLNRSTAGFAAISFGIGTDKPVSGDFDADGKADIAVYRDGNWYYLRSSDNGFVAVAFGIATDKPVAADYDGDGKTDPAVYRNGIWYLLQSANGFSAASFGISTDTPVPADYDGDGKADIGVFRDGNWYMLQSANGFSAQFFGTTNDLPTPATRSP